MNIIKINDRVRYKRKSDFSFSEGIVKRIDGFGNVYIENPDLKIRTVCNLSDILQIIKI